MFLNRRSRAIGELDKLLDMREKCESGTPEATSLDQAIGVLASRLSKRVRRRMDPIGIATVLIVAILLFGLMYLFWAWTLSSDGWWLWVPTVVITFGSIIFLAAGIPSLSKVEGEEGSREAK